MRGKDNFTPEEQANSKDISVDSGKLTELAGKISTFNRYGYAMPEAAISGSSSDRSLKRSLRTPGIAVYSWVPTVGVANSKTDPVNLAYEKKYRKVRKENSGARNYQPIDMAVLDMAEDSFLNFWKSVNRVRILVHKCETENAYVGRPMVRALGYDYDDIVRNYPTLLSQLQVWKEIATTWAQLPGMKFHDVHDLMQSAIYQDGDIEKAQFYVFEQASYAAYTYVDQAKGLEMVTWQTSATVTHTVDEIIAFGNSLLYPIINSDDFALINGDIEKAFGESETKVVLPEVSWDGEVAFVKSDRILSAIMNATVIPVDPTSCLAVDTATNTIVCQPKLAPVTYTSGSGDLRILVPGYGSYILTAVSEQPSTIQLKEFFTYGQNRILNFVMRDPSPVDTSVASRWTVRLTAAEDDATPLITACGTEIICGCCLISVGVDARGAWDSVAVDQVLTNHIVPIKTEDSFDPGNSDIFTRERLFAALNLTNFDWHHPVQLVAFDEVADGGVYTLNSLGFMVDYQNNAYVDDDVIRKLHEARLFGAFDYEG